MGYNNVNSLNFPKVTKEGYVQRTGCQWEMLPHDLPSYSTVYGYFHRTYATVTYDHSPHQARECQKAPRVQVVGLRHFLAPKGAENLSGQGKEVDDQKMPETLVNTGFMLFRAESLSLSRFEAIFLSVFV